MPSRASTLHTHKTYCFVNLTRHTSYYYAYVPDIQSAFELAVGRWPHDAIRLFKILPPLY